MADVQYLIVAGGGGGGFGYFGGNGGGGGAGGLLTGTGTIVATGSFPIVVGLGGAGGDDGTSATSQNGGDSSFNGLTALGGGGGGGPFSDQQPNGKAGGSGGGGGGVTGATGGAGTSGQGSDGGTIGTGNEGLSSGGGGGAGGPGGSGQSAVFPQGGAGGVGVSSDISGTATFYAGGGGGSDSGVGGTGGGGAGSGFVGAGGDGAPNTGGGGGGARNESGGAGGSGIVIIRYATGDLTATGGTITTVGGDTVHTFTSSGTFEVTALAGGGIDPVTGVGAAVAPALSLSNPIVAGVGAFGPAAVTGGGAAVAPALLLANPAASGAGAYAEPPLDIIGYGQSNWLFHETNGDGAGTPHPDTFAWNGSAFVAPSGAGTIALLNSLQAATGRVCRLVGNGAGGTNIAGLQSGTTPYTDLIAEVTASGIDPAYIVFQHGETDGEQDILTEIEYEDALNTLHTSLAASTGKTIATLPMVVASVSPLGSGNPDGWQRIKAAQATVTARYPNIHFSHSNMDATLVDNYHWDGPSYGRSGARYAETIKALEGLASVTPRFYATGAEILTGTTTRVDLTHEDGTDFTPTSGITGFQVSDDDGENWEAATGARLDADSITLTHSDMGTVERLVRYNHGATNFGTGDVLDNSAIAAPLVYTTTNLVAADVSITPVTATGAATAPALLLANPVAAGSGAFSVAAVTGVGVAIAPALALANPTASGAGTFVLAGVTGIGAANAPPLVLAAPIASGAGAFVPAGVVGVGAAQAPLLSLANPVASGTGAVGPAAVTGGGAAVAPVLVLSNPVAAAVGAHFEFVLGDPEQVFVVSPQPRETFAISPEQTTFTVMRKAA